jgi:6-oxo-cyclohex-1-ene-carbonyl-CoA hydrolase
MALEWLRRDNALKDHQLFDDGEIIYGEPVATDRIPGAKALLAQCTTDFELLDTEVNRLVWKFANLFPNCLISSIDGIRGKKKFFWDQMKFPNRHWAAANMNHEAFLGFNAFDTKKKTGEDVVDFVKFRQLVAEGALFDDGFAEQTLARPKA